MFFLLRCLFWLGLAFSHIAALEGTNATALANQGVRDLSERATGLGRMAVDAAGEKCRAEPEKCLALAAQAAAFGQGAAKKDATVQAREASSRDTLNTGDRIPTWRLRTE
jgi:hypothetical protein